MFRFLVAFAVLCCCLAGSVSASRLPTKIESVQVGIENTYKNGLWTPITVHLWGTSSEESHKLAIRCSDSDGTPITYHYEIIGEKATALAKLGRKDEPIQVSFETILRPDSEYDLSREDFPNMAEMGKFKTFPVPPPVNAERPIYLIFGNDDIGLQGAVAELMLREDRRPLLVKVNSFADLPTEWFGYESVEMVILSTTEPALFEGLSANSPQIQALNDWLKLGGKMLLCAGKDSEQFLDDEDGFLHLFLPGKYDGMTELRISTPLERFVNSQRQIFMNGTEEAPFMKMPRILEPSGITFVKDGDLPLVLRCAHGLGTIIYFGGDLNGRPLGNWRDRTTLVRNVMQWNRAQDREMSAPRSGAMLQLGYNDILGQIRSALDQFEGVRIVPFSVILMILTAYWLVIGLFDWFFVHKVLKKPILTWITFPMWIVLFSVLTYVLAVPGRPAEGRNKELFLYDVDYETGVTHYCCFSGRYSPKDALNTVFGSITSNGDITPGGYLSWLGLPGSGLGGMAPKTVSPSVWQVGSEQQNFEVMTSVPFQTHSTKSFFGRGFQDYPQRKSQIHVQLSDEEGVPVGTLEVPDDFDFHLKNCILVYGRWALELGEIVPGQTITVTKTTPRRDLRDLLIPPQTLDNENLRRLATYNPQSADLEYIVRVMSLHRALGGYEATGLHHAYQPSLDMSELLTTDRALLMGVDLRESEPFIGDNFDPIVGRYIDPVIIFPTIIFRTSLPITLTPSSPRWQGERELPGGGALDESIRPGFVTDPLPGGGW